MIIVISIVLLLALLASVEIGYRYGAKRRAASGGDEKDGQSTVETAVFALLGLILAFSFAAAAQRMDNRRTLSVNEANAIGTAYLRIDMMPRGAQTEMRKDFLRYIDARLSFNENLSDDSKLDEPRKATAGAQRDIWKLAIANADGPAPTQVSGTLIPALNEMFDLATSRDIATQTHVPAVVVALLVLLALLSGFMAGKTMLSKKGSRAHQIIFAVVIASTIYVITDLEFPRLGLIRLDSTDALLRSLKNQAQSDLHIE